jgi:hypothetical protein
MLAGSHRPRHIFSMKSITLLAVLSLMTAGLVSCEITDSREAGGAAFSGSHLARQLDANAPLDDPKTPGSESYEHWREKE